MMPGVSEQKPVSIRLGPQAAPKPVSPPPAYQPPADGAALQQDSLCRPMPGAYPTMARSPLPQTPRIDANLSAINALASAFVEITTGAEAVEQELVQVHKQLPWLVRRLGGAVGRVVLPVVTGATVVFVALCLPYVALSFGALAGFITWYLLRDPDPAPSTDLARPKPHALKVRRPRLQYAKLKLQSAIYCAEKAQLRATLAECKEHQGTTAAALLAARLSDLETKLKDRHNALKAVQDALGMNRRNIPVPGWDTAVNAANLLNAVGAVVEAPLGPLWRGLWSLLSPPLIAVASLFYLDRGVKQFAASISAERQALEDGLYLLGGEIEALTRIKSAYGYIEGQTHGAMSVLNVATALAGVHTLWRTFQNAYRPASVPTPPHRPAPTAAVLLRCALNPRAVAKEMGG